MPRVGWVAAVLAAVVAAVLAAVVVGTPWAPDTSPPAASSPGSSSAEAPSGGTAGESPSEQGSPCTHYVATNGSDEARGTQRRPWRTLAASMARLEPGDTLCVTAGTYAEEISGPVPDGRPGAPITLLGLPAGGQRPVVHGGFALIDPDYWTLSGLLFTNPTPVNPDNRLVSILGGTGWVFEDNEVVDGPYAGMLVAASTVHGPPADYTIRHNVIHRTTAANLYLNPSRFSTGGLVEYNLFFDAGTENVKLGWGGEQVCTGPSFEAFGIGELTFRYNTLHGATRGALYIAEPGGRYSVDVYRNLFSGQPDHLVRYDSVEGCLGDRVTVHDNVGGLAPAFSEDFGDSPVNVGHERGNRFPVDPAYLSETPDGFRPATPEARGYGRYAQD